LIFLGGGLFEGGGLFDDAPMGEVPSLNEPSELVINFVFRFHG